MKKGIKSTLCLLLAAVILPWGVPQTAAAESAKGAELTVNEVKTSKTTPDTTGKEEVVYANLSGNGAVDSIYVVNRFERDKEGLLADYGDYTDVKNLSNTNPITLDGNAVNAEAGKGSFYYQGTMSQKRLPWSFQLAYFLDGKEVAPDKIGGKSGELEIRLKSQFNGSFDESFKDQFMLQITLTLDAEKCGNIASKDATIANAGKDKTVVHTVMPGKDADIFVSASVRDFEMPAIQIAAMPFSMSIELPDTDEMVDDMTTLTDAIAELNDGVRDLLDGTVELHDGVGELLDGSVEMVDGIGELDDGSGDLTSGSRQIQSALSDIASALNGSGLGSGITKLLSGSTDFASGLSDLNDNSSTLTAGSEAIKSALSTIAASLNGSGGGAGMDLGALAELPDGLRQMATGLGSMSTALTQLRNGYDTMLTTLDDAMNIPAVSDDDIAMLGMAVATMTDSTPEKAAAQQALDNILASYSAGQTAQGTYGSLRNELRAVSGGLIVIIEGDGTAENPGLTGMVSGLNMLADTIEDALSASDMMEQIQQLAQGITELSTQYNQFHAGLVAYTGGVTQLKSGYGELHSGLKQFGDGVYELRDGTRELADEYGTFHDGLLEYADGVSELKSGYGELHDGIMELHDGTADLDEGVRKLYDGTTELQEETADLPDTIQVEIDKMTADYDVEYTPVSFTSPRNTNISSVQFVIMTAPIKLPDEPKTTENQVEKTSIWDRFLDLFR